MPLPEGFLDLIDELASRTKSGSVEWQELNGRGRFFAVIGDVSFQLTPVERSYTDEDGDIITDKLLRFELINSNGEEIYSVDRGDGDQGYVKLSSLYDEALLKARDVPSIISTVLTDLRKNELSGVADLLLKIHRANPGRASYASQSLLDKYDIAVLDRAYEDLLKRKLVKRLKNLVSVEGNPRNVFVLEAS